MKEYNEQDLRPNEECWEYTFYYRDKSRHFIDPYIRQQKAKVNVYRYAYKNAKGELFTCQRTTLKGCRYVKDLWLQGLVTNTGGKIIK